MSRFPLRFAALALAIAALAASPAEARHRHLTAHELAIHQALLDGGADEDPSPTPIGVLLERFGEQNDRCLDAEAGACQSRDETAREIKARCGPDPFHCRELR